MTTDYTTLAAAKTVAGIPDADTSRDAVIAFLIPKVSRHIDRYCKRFFYLKSGITYTYDYQSEYRLWLRGDLQALTSLQNGDGTMLDVSTLFLYPIAGPPYHWIDWNRSSGLTFRWSPTTPQQCIHVTGDWGYLEDGETPEPITDACAEWIKYILQVNKLAGVKSKTIGDYSVSYSNVLDVLRQGPPNEVGFYLDGYVKRRFATTSVEVAP